MVVPAYRPPPAASLDDGPLRFAGICDIALHDFASGVADALRLQGYALIREPDWALLAQAPCLAEVGDE